MRKEAAAAIFRCAQIDCAANSRDREKKIQTRRLLQTRRIRGRQINKSPLDILVLVCFTRDGHNKGRRSHLHFNARIFYI
jgi:hypothetical protein